MLAGSSWYLTMHHMIVKLKPPRSCAEIQYREGEKEGKGTSAMASSREQSQEDVERQIPTHNMKSMLKMLNQPGSVT